ncbi:MAG: hypothetical protein AB8B64_21790 [Granulosicoccus sp.]
MTLRHTGSSALAAVTLFTLITPIHQTSHATEAIIIGGGSEVHGSDTRFETSVRWVGSILSDHDVTFTTHFNDGQATEPDIFDHSTDPAHSRPLARIFGNAELLRRHYRNHSLSKVDTSTRIKDLGPVIKSRLKDNIDEELLFIHSGFGSHTGASEDSVSMNLWNNEKLTAKELHQLLEQHDRPIRFIFGHSYSGGFHRLAYRDPSTGLALSDTTHCGFTSQSAYALAEFNPEQTDDGDYRDYLSYFFSALSGYEYDGQIISRFADLNEDGETSLREAHLFAMEEAMSVDRPLSTSEDYLLRWQPWYLRWQPSQKPLPNNEYTRIFRTLANRLKIPLDDNAAKSIREKMAQVTSQVQAIEQRLLVEQASINHLRSMIRTELVSKWPSLAEPYTHGFEALIRADTLLSIDSYSRTLKPEYDELLSLQKQTQLSKKEHLEIRREAAQYQKLLQLRHLALVKQQLIQYGKAQQIGDYRSLLRCEQAPLRASTATTQLTEETTQ